MGAMLPSRRAERERERLANLCEGTPRVPVNLSPDPESAMTERAHLLITTKVNFVLFLTAFLSLLRQGAQVKPDQQMSSVSSVRSAVSLRQQQRNRWSIRATTIGCPSDVAS